MSDLERLLKPAKLDISSSQSDCEVVWIHWRTTFENYLEQSRARKNTIDNGRVVEAEDFTDKVKLAALANLVSTSIFSMVSHAACYKDAIKILNETFVKSKNEAFQRYLLASRKQGTSETIDQYKQALGLLAKECAFREGLTSVQQEQECLRDAFIRGIRSDETRQRLFENDVTEWDKMVTMARAIESSYSNSSAMRGEGNVLAAAISDNLEPWQGSEQDDTIVCAAMGRGRNGRGSSYGNWRGQGSDRRCYFCGYENHPRSSCPALNVTCRTCGIAGHFQQVCKKRNRQGLKGKPQQQYQQYQPGPREGNVLAAARPFLPDATINVKVNESDTLALIDSGSTFTFMNGELVSKLGLSVDKSTKKQISLASRLHSCQVEGSVLVDLVVAGHLHPNFKVLVMSSLCSDFIIGHDLLSCHEKLVLHFNGSKPPIVVNNLESGFACALEPSTIECPSLFKHMPENVFPVACKSRKFSGTDREFIQKEVERLRSDGIIEPSDSPWRAQVLVTGGDRQKRRMVVDYSRTVNKFNHLDAFPLPNMDDQVRDVAKYAVYSAYDLKSAYHQVCISETDKKFTAFEAAGQLFQFTRIPFGINNGVPAFQRAMHNIIEREHLEGVFAYLDNIAVAGHDQKDHDSKVDKFITACKKYNLTLNPDKTITSVTEIAMLGFLISKGKIRPDPERMRPLLDLPVPTDERSLKRVLGLFSYYSQWVPKFSDKIKPLTGNPQFPLSEEALAAFSAMKNCIAESWVTTPNDNDLLVVETDASGYALSASLNQSGKPVAFFSRSLKEHERRHSSIEKEACAIVEACRKWRHYLTGRKFLLITDQQAVSYMFNKAVAKDIAKNDKIMRWRIELSCLDFDIRYRPGSANPVADCLSRDIPGEFCCHVPSFQSLEELHKSLCHPGQVKMIHYVRISNLPYSVEEVKRLCAECRVCAIEKPRYFRPVNPPLIKSTKPFERLSIDFKGALPTVTRNSYMLTVVDEYSRFTFAFPCADMTTETVKGCLEKLFSLFGEPHSVHSDRGPGFISRELKDWLLANGIHCSNSAPYNPQGNGQCERYNGVLWKNVNLALRCKGLGLANWEMVLPDALHAARTLVCTTTNEIPHDRFMGFPRRMAAGRPLPSWLTSRGKVLLKRHVKKSKYEDDCEEVDLIETHPTFARVRMPSGVEKSVSLRHLAPLPLGSQKQPGENITGIDPPSVSGSAITPGKCLHPAGDSVIAEPVTTDPVATPDPAPVLVPTGEATTTPTISAPRRSARESKMPERLGYQQLGGG